MQKNNIKIERNAGGSINNNDILCFSGLNSATFYQFYTYNRHTKKLNGYKTISAPFGIDTVFEENLLVLIEWLEPQKYALVIRTLDDLTHIIRSIDIPLDAHSCRVDISSRTILVTNPSFSTLTTYDLDTLEQINVIDGVPIKPEVETFSNHINSAEFYNGDIYYTTSYINRRKYPSGAAAVLNHGYILKFPGHEIITADLCLPHSLVIQDDHIYVCESVNGYLRKYTLKGRFVSHIHVGGVPRGLKYLGEDMWVVGVSINRHLRAGNIESCAQLQFFKENKLNGIWDVIEHVKVPGVTEIFEIYSLKGNR